MVNILPPKTQRELRLMYYSRLFGTLLVLVALITAIGAGVLTPAYFLAQEEADSSRRYADALKQTLSLNESSSAGRAVPVLSEQIKIMKTYQTKATVGPALDRMVGAIPASVSVQKVSFRFSAKSEGQIVVTGRAQTRSALLSFVDALKKEPLFKGVTVPVSDLISDNDLPFTLTFSIAPPAP